MVDGIQRDSLDNFFETFVKEAAPKKSREEMKETQKKELDLWHHWNNNGRQPEHLHPLYDSYQGMLRREVMKYPGLEIPTATIKAEVDKHFVNAMKSFDPKKAQLNTWVQTNLRKASRYVKTYQNIGKIPEGQISKINDFKQARDHLSAHLGHEPDVPSLADHLKWSPRRVMQMQKELSRRDLMTSTFQSDPAELLTPKELEAIKLMQYDLSSEERAVYEYTFGMNGRQRLGPGQIAKATNIHPSKVSRIRNRLTAKLQEAMELL